MRSLVDCSQYVMLPLCLLSHPRVHARRLHIGYAAVEREAPLAAAIPTNYVPQRGC